MAYTVWYKILTVENFDELQRIRQFCQYFPSNFCVICLRSLTYIYGNTYITYNMLNDMQIIYFNIIEGWLKNTKVMLY